MNALAQALDTGSGVTWTKSADNRFVPIPLTGALNGTAAGITLQEGQESWIQAAVTGPGIFDFWLLDREEGVPAWDYRVKWELWIDGKQILIQGPTWDPVWITTAGAHQVKILLRNKVGSGVTFSAAVDAVTRKPLAPVAVDATWKSSGGDTLVSFSNGGVNTERVHVLRSHGAGTRWIEKTVTGPGVLEWHSSIGQGERFSSASPFQVMLDGVCKLPAGSGSDWVKQRLVVPMGTHTVRWIADEAPPEIPEWMVGEAYNAFCLLSGVSFTAGVPAFVTAVDYTGNAWLQVGQPGVAGGGAGSTVAGGASFDGVDAFAYPGGIEVYFCNLSGLGATLGGRISNGGEWRVGARVFSVGDCQLWAAGSEWNPLKLDSVSVETWPEVTLGAAMDMAGEPDSGGMWKGVGVPAKAFDRSDVIWSRLDGPITEDRVKTSLTGPARITFQWRVDRGRLALKLDDGYLAVTAAGADWARAELEVGEGPHTLEWIHSPGSGSSPALPSEAWIDAVTILPLGEFPLGTGTTGDTGIALRRLEQTAETGQWRATAYKNNDGTVVTAARVVGSGKMAATVTGPVMLRFAARCQGPGPLVTGASDSTHSSISLGTVIVNPGFPSIYTYDLSVSLNNEERARIGSDQSGAWDTVTMFVPEGEHEVIWQARTRTPSVVINPVVTNGGSAQGWVDSMELISVRAHYDEWAARRGFPAGKEEPEMDADGDGHSNFAEYAFGSDPRSASSLPPALSGSMNYPFGSLAAPGYPFNLYVPYLPPHVEGVLEVSDDLEQWAPYITPLRRFQQPRSGVIVVGYGADTATHQYIGVSREGKPTRYFRLRLISPLVPSSN